MCVAGCRRECALPSSGYAVSQELGRPAVKDQVGDVDATLMFVEGGGTLDAVGNAELATDEAGNGFGLEGPETI